MHALSLEGTLPRIIIRISDVRLFDCITRAIRSGDVISQVPAVFDPRTATNAHPVCPIELPFDTAREDSKLPNSVEFKIFDRHLDHQLMAQDRLGQGMIQHLKESLVKHTCKII